MKAFEIHDVVKKYPEFQDAEKGLKIEKEMKR